MLVPTITRHRGALSANSQPSAPLHHNSLRHSAVCQARADETSRDNLFASLASRASLPGIGEQILRLPWGQEGVETTLIEVVQTDPALTASILRRVNSPYFRMTRKVNNLERAATLLGTPELRNLALTALVKRMFDHPATYGSYDRQALWRHSLAVAVSARKIARVTGVGLQHEAYLAGLLHHVGTLLIDLHLRSDFCSLVDQLDDEQPTPRQERDLLSFDQAQLGAHVAGSWRFPESIRAAIRFHESPADDVGEHAQLVYVIKVADYLCSRAGITAMGIFNTAPPPDLAYTILGVDRVAIAIIWDDLLTHLDVATDF